MPKARAIVDNEEARLSALRDLNLLDTPPSESFDRLASRLLADSRFADSPRAQAGIRFYAGAPLVTQSGFGLGTLCVVDDKPRQLDDEQGRAPRRRQAAAWRDAAMPCACR